MTPIVRQSCSSNMFNHWVAPIHCRCCSFLGNMCGSTNPVAQLTLPSHIVLKLCKIHWRNLTRFDKIAIKKYKFQMASGQGSHWLIDSPTILYLCINCPYQIYAALCPLVILRFLSIYSYRYPHYRLLR